MAGRHRPGPVTAAVLVDAATLDQPDVADTIRTAAQAGHEVALYADTPGHVGGHVYDHQLTGHLDHAVTAGSAAATVLAHRADVHLGWQQTPTVPAPTVYPHQLDQIDTLMAGPPQLGPTR